jgi:ABC-type branched-subunit amino acid transport system substrate-binding protein
MAPSGARRALALSVTALAVASWVLPVAAQSAEPVRLGALLSVTGNPANGLTAQTGYKMAVDEINAAGGIMGRKVEMIIADDANDPTQAVTSVKRLVSRDKIHIMVGPMLSQATLAIAPVLTEAKVANISVSGSSAITPKVAPYHFSLFTSIQSVAVAMTNHAQKNLKAKSIAILTDTGSQGKAAQEELQRLLPQRGITITGVQHHDPKPSDVTAQVLALRRGNPDVIIHVGSSGEDAGVLLKNLDELGWKVPVVSNTTSLNVPMITRHAGPNAYTGGNVHGQLLKAYTHCPNDAVGQTEFGKFIARLKAYDPKNFEQLNQQVVSMAYDGVYILKAAVEGTKSFDGATIAAWMEKNAGSVSGRINGPLAASSDNHFLVGPDAIVFVNRPDQKRADGAALRGGC